MNNITDTAASKLLGKKIEGCDTYNPSFLVAVPRTENRIRYNIDENNMPFDGFDVWHAYEFSSMTQNGLPYTRVLKLKYSCCSKFIVESKSLKLYLNSFNMSRYGKNIKESLNICAKVIQKDLSELLKTEVVLSFLDVDTEHTKIFDGFENVLDFVDCDNLKIENFKESPELLEVEETRENKEYFLNFDSLRSNCRVTHQPDFGSAFIYYKSKQHIKESSLIRYLCSFRCEYHFHEECCEMVYKRLFDLLDDKNDELMVCILYTRRGGIDICPIRYSKNCQNLPVFKDLSDITKYAINSINR